MFDVYTVCFIFVLFTQFWPQHMHSIFHYFSSSAVIVSRKFHLPSTKWNEMKFFLNLWHSYEAQFTYCVINCSRTMKQQIQCDCSLKTIRDLVDCLTLFTHKNLFFLKCLFHFFFTAAVQRPSFWKLLNLNLQQYALHTQMKVIQFS